MRNIMKVRREKTRTRVVGRKGHHTGDNPRKNPKKTGQSKKGLEKDRPSQEPVWWGGGDTTRGTIQEGIGRRRAKTRARVVGHHTGTMNRDRSKMSAMTTLLGNTGWRLFTPLIIIVGSK